MGRSQVLYNRTKGRNRSRAGRGGGEIGTDDGNQKDRSNSNSRNRNLPPPQSQRGLIDDYQNNRKPQKNYEEEYEILFAGRDTHLSSVSIRKDDDNENEESYLGGNTGSICLLSMAATLRGMDVAKRLRIPLRVAARAFPSSAGTENDPAVEDEKEDLQPHSNHQEGYKGKSQEEDGEAGDTEGIPAGAALIPFEIQDDDNDDDDDNNDDDDDDDAWLDDECGMNDDATKPATKGGITVASVVSNPATNDALAKAKRELGGGDDDGEDDLDDWLDSVI